MDKVFSSRIPTNRCEINIGNEKFTVVGSRCRRNLILLLLFFFFILFFFCGVVCRIRRGNAARAA